MDRPGEDRNGKTYGLLCRYCIGVNAILMLEQQIKLHWIKCKNSAGTTKKNYTGLSVYFLIKRQDKPCKCNVVTTNN